ncbi:hypothetical protein [Micromonospora matsumotoense]|uniref:hypothetical protein n=1 Tax=Micromonospora matsumotoense TaxID=121616 RepID=UPI0033C6E663
MDETSTDSKPREQDNEKEKAAPSIPLRGVLRRYLTSLRGVEQIVEVSRSTIPSTNAINHTIDVVAVERGVSLSIDQREAIKDIILEHIISYRDLFLEIENAGEGGSSKEELEARYKHRLDAIWSGTYERFFELGNSSAQLALDIMLSVHPNALQREPSALFYSSLLVSTVGMCEVFLGQTMRAFLRLKPEALSGTEIRFKFSDINQFDSIESLREHHIERQVESVIRQGGIDDWIKWFEAKINIGFPQITSDARSMREVFQRRHIHVHNDGDVSDLYLAKMHDLPDPPAMGEYLAVDEQYLLRAVNQLRSIGIVLSVLIARKLTPRSPISAALDELEEYACSLVYGLLKSENYDFVIELCKLLSDDTRQQGRRMRLQVNSWIARSKKSDKKYLSEVEAWDTSALGLEYQVARFTLLGDFRSAFPLVQEMIQRGPFDVDDYNQWPLFDVMRGEYPLGSAEQADEARSSVDADSSSNLDGQEQSRLPRQSLPTAATAEIDDNDTAP